MASLADDGEVRQASSWLIEQQESTVDIKTLTRRLCPHIYETSCLDDDKMVGRAGYKKDSSLA